jgi:prevent-host-death family protein
MYVTAYGLMYNRSVANEFMSVARLRAEMADVLARLGHDGPLYLTQRGKPRAVLLDVDEYRVLLEQLEHLDDSLEALLARERRERGEETSRPLVDVIRARRAVAPVRQAKRKAANRAHARVSR